MVVVFEPNDSLGASSADMEALWCAYGAEAWWVEELCSFPQRFIAGMSDGA